MGKWSAFDPLPWLRPKTIPMVHLLNVLSLESQEKVSGKYFCHIPGCFVILKRRFLTYFPGLVSYTLILSPFFLCISPFFLYIFPFSPISPQISPFSPIFPFVRQNGSAEWRVPARRMDLWLHIWGRSTTWDCCWAWSARLFFFILHASNFPHFPPFFHLGPFS